MAGKLNRLEISVHNVHTKQRYVCEMWKYKCTENCRWRLFKDGLYLQVGEVLYICVEFAL
ncbi:hypothetical protein R1sor_021418 [Riccia sorocarpa]|uniref:Uncharacterized protein n=1 Tax=Riccia sorocarpa TaxID=122646 RepID=A0ABD3GIV4_9MARC